MQQVKIEEESSQHRGVTGRRVVPSNLEPDQLLQVHSSSKVLLVSEQLEQAQRGEIPLGLGTTFASSFRLLPHRDFLALR